MKTKQCVQVITWRTVIENFAKATMSKEKMNPGFFKGIKRRRTCVPSLVEQQDDPSKLGLADIQKFNLCITFLTMLDDSVKLTLKMQ